MICEETNNSFSSTSSHSSEEANQYISSINLHQDIEIIKSLNQAKFSVYLAQSSSTKQKFAMKIFPLNNGNVVNYYYNEIRFANLDHKNVISIVHADSSWEIFRQGQSCIFSCTIMEYAPFGDFFDALMTHKVKFDDKLLRTYFHQLINGLEYLHSMGVSHLDLKPENLLLGSEFQLKIADFDLSYKKGDLMITGKGTKNYRAPELIKGNCKITEAADVFSAAIILFLLKSEGIIPQMEDASFRGCNLYNALQINKSQFWAIHNDLKKNRNYYDADFKQLFESMTRENVSDRATIEQIKNSKWYNGPTYSDKEIQDIMNKNLGI